MHFVRAQQSQVFLTCTQAALNMMTRTSAPDLQKKDIYMTAVDTGWINDENPLEKASKIFKTNNFQTPLDEVCTARVMMELRVSSLLFHVERCFVCF